VAGAACDPGSCDASFDCGFKACDGLACRIFFFGAETTCRPTAGDCDLEETCGGSSLDCPADVKKSAATVCRPPVDACDAAERCDGVSATCDAPDIGLEPTLSRVTLLTRAYRFAGAENDQREFFAEVSGQDLCNATLETPNLDSLHLEGDGGPSDRIAASLVYFPSKVAPDPANGSYTLDINRGAAGGGLEYAAGAPDGFVDILAPSQLATAPAEPSFSISNGCADCDVIRAEILDGATQQVLVETPPSFSVPLGTPTEIALADFLGAPPDGLPDHPYRIVAEAIDGSLVPAQTFTGGPGSPPFAYLSGTSERNLVNFSVPEAVVEDATVRFQGLGQLPNGNSSSATDVSNDGTVVVGSARVGSDTFAFRWTQADGMVSLGELDGGEVFSEAWAVSGDGSIVVGLSDSGVTVPFGNQAFRWSAADGMDALPPVNVVFGDSSALGISDDGSTIVGWNYFTSSTFSAFFSTETSGITPMDGLTVAMDASENGAIVAGYDMEQAKVATAFGPAPLGRLGADNHSEAQAITPDGTTVVGWSFGTSSDFLGSEPFLWTLGSDAIVGLGYRSDRVNQAADVSADGSMIVGSIEGGGTTDVRAFLWTPERGVRTLEDVLVEDYGVTLPGWTLYTASGISADGSTIVGSGDGPNGSEAWILTIPEPAPAPALWVGWGAVTGVAGGRRLASRRRWRARPPTDAHADARRGTGSLAVRRIQGAAMASEPLRVAGDRRLVVDVDEARDAIAPELGGLRSRHLEWRKRSHAVGARPAHDDPVALTLGRREGPQRAHVAAAVEAVDRPAHSDEDLRPPAQPAGQRPVLDSILGVLVEVSLEAAPVVVGEGSLEVGCVGGEGLE
jgi:probable HAF family extracellular repeat protein